MIHCPICTKTDDPLAQVRHIAICRTCASTLYVSDSETRLSRYADIEDFGPMELQELRNARAAIAPFNRSPRIATT